MGYKVPAQDFYALIVRLNGLKNAVLSRHTINFIISSKVMSIIGKILNMNLMVTSF